MSVVPLFVAAVAVAVTVVAVDTEVAAATAVFLTCRENGESNCAAAVSEDHSLRAS